MWQNGSVDCSEKNEAEGKRNENTNTVSLLLFSDNLNMLRNCVFAVSLTENVRGLDNAGKTTILKRFNGEEIDTISPTLGFNIKTLEHRG